MPKFIECEQGTNEWYLARRGIPTASEFAKIITPAKGEYSAQARPYMLRLLAEKMLGENITDIGNLHAVERGKLLEPQAALAYEIEQGCEVARAGFVVSDCRRYGASPDLIVAGKPGWVEIKCPQADTHLRYWFDGFGNDYHCQRQGQMFVGELEWIDMFSYHPRLPSKIARVYRDDAFIAKLAAALDRFCYEMAQLEAQLRATGYFDQIASGDDGWEGYLRRLEKQGEVLGSG